LHNLYGPSETCVDSTHQISSAQKPRFEITNVSGWTSRSRSGARLPTSDLYPGRLFTTSTCGWRGEVYIAERAWSGYLNDPSGPRKASSLIIWGRRRTIIPDRRWASYSWMALSVFGQDRRSGEIARLPDRIGEIEHALAAHPQVKQAVVVIQRSIPLLLIARAIRCGLRCAETSGSLATQELRSYLKRKLRHICSRSHLFAWMHCIVANGKIDRLELAALKPLRHWRMNILPSHAARKVLAGCGVRY